MVGMDKPHAITFAMVLGFVLVSEYFMSWADPTGEFRQQDAHEKIHGRGSWDDSMHEEPLGGYLLTDP
jgi:hypothetical protein